jgi:murein DD-endopeptidase MepM/ murein hydrolase activator NlpD
MNFEEGKEKIKKHVKKKIGKAIRKAVVKVIKKVAIKLVMLIMKAIITAITALIGVIGVPTALILAVVIILGGAMFMLAPSLGLIDGDSPVSQKQLKSELNSLLKKSSADPNYRPPFELVTSIDLMRIIQEDAEPWEVDFEPIVDTLSPDLTYEDFTDTYEIKTVTTTTTEVTEEGSGERVQVGTERRFVCSDEELVTMPIERIERLCYRDVPVYEGESPTTKTVTETDTDIKEEKKKVSLLKKVHAWNRIEEFYYKETEMKEEFKLVSVKEEGNKKIEVYKRKKKAWVFDGKDFEYDYTKFDQILSELELEESAIELLVEALKYNNIPMDGYMGKFFDTFIEGGMGMMIPPEYMEIYKAAEKKYNVKFNYLAAIHYVETKFSTIDIMESHVGAIGHLQFMDCTWVGWSYSSCGGLGDGNIPNKDLVSPSVIAKHGGYGVDANNDGKSDPWDLEDAVFAAAKYLKASGFETNIKKAIRSYNHSDKYVADVVHYAELFVSTQGAIPPISAGTFTRPANGPITSDYGPRSGGMHHGVDVGKRENVVPIVAAADGTVSKSYVSKSYGETIFIEHIIDGQKWETVYAHMVSGSRRVQAGEQVSKGQVIGIMGSTGRSSGPHLHFEIHMGGWNQSKSNSVSPTKSGLIQW